MRRPFALTAFCLAIAACNPQTPVPPAQPAGPSAVAPAPVAGHAIVNWGQRSTPAGTPFNVQRDGNSGVSFELNQPAPAGEITVTFDGKALPGVAASGVIVTATIPGDLIARPGRYPVELRVPETGLAIPAGDFEVK